MTNLKNFFRPLAIAATVAGATLVGTACGVKKPPQPAYTFPSDWNPSDSPSPTPRPGFSNPSGPLETPSS